MRSTSLLAKSWWHKVLTQSCRSGSVAQPVSLLFWSSKVPCLFSYPCREQERGKKIYLDSWAHTADFPLLGEPVHEPNGCLRFSATKASQNSLQSGDTQAHNSFPSTLAIECYLFRLCLNTTVFLSGVLFSCLLCVSLLSASPCGLGFKVSCPCLPASEVRNVWWLLSAATFTFRRSPVPAPVGRSPLSVFADVIYMSSLSSSLPWRHKLTLSGSSAFLVSEWTEIQWLNLSSHGRHSLNLYFRLLFLSLIFIPAKLCLCVCVFVHMHVCVFMLHRHMWYVFIYVCIAHMVISHLLAPSILLGNGKNI